MDNSHSTPGLPSVEHLRERCALEGVFPSDEDLAATAAFLDTILPLLAELEGELPTDQEPAGLFHPDVPA